MSTETVSPRFAEIDIWSTQDAVAALAEAQMGAAAAVRMAHRALADAADAAAARLRRGHGRLIYCGAGASGRIAMQDGVELHPTFGWPDGRLVYLMAGGDAALVRSQEGAEDDRAVADEVAALGAGPQDVLIAVAASGRTPYAVAAMEAAGARGCLTVAVTNNPGTPLADGAAHPIVLDTGPEVIAGSTRMAAGTAQKIALNVLSSAIMIRLNRTFGNLMSDLASSNAKLEARRLDILRRIVPAPEAAARRALEAAGGDIKIAALALRGLGAEDAAARLGRADGSLRAVLADCDADVTTTTGRKT